MKGIYPGEIKAQTVKYKLDDFISKQHKELQQDIAKGSKFFDTNTQPRAENYNTSLGAVTPVTTTSTNRWTYEKGNKTSGKR